MSVSRVIHAVLEAEFNLNNIKTMLSTIENLGFSWRVNPYPDSESPELLKLAETIYNGVDRSFFIKSKFSHWISIEKMIHNGKAYILFGLWDYYKEPEKPYQNMTYHDGYENNIKFIMSLIPDFKIKKIYYKEDDSMISDNSVDIAQSPIIIFNTEFADEEELILKDSSLIYENIKKLNAEIFGYLDKSVVASDKLKSYIATGIRYNFKFYIKLEDHYTSVVISYDEENFNIIPLKPYKLTNYLNKTDIDTQFYVNLALKLIDGFGVKKDFIIDGF